MPEKKPLYLETTEVPASRSLAEVSAVLVAAGASSIQTLYENGKPIGLQWSMRLYGVDVWFRLPAKIEPVFQLLRKRRRGSVTARDQEALKDRAERVAWRQLLTWVKVQMSLIELGMVEYGQVFFPYMQEHPNARPAWEWFRDEKFKLLPGADKPQ